MTTSMVSLATRDRVRTTMRIIGTNALALLVFCIPTMKAGIEICATICVGTWLIESICARRILLPATMPRVVIMTASALMGVNVLSALICETPVMSLLDAFFKIGEYLLLFCIAGEYVAHDKRVERLLFMALMASVVLVFVDLAVQWYTGTDLLRRFHAPYRLCGPFKNANNLSGWLITLVPIVLGVFMTSMSFKRFDRHMIISVGMVVVLVSGLFYLAMTFSRGAWLGLFVGIILFSCLLCSSHMAMRKKMTILILMGWIAVCFLTGLALYHPTHQRMMTVTKGVAMGGRRYLIWQEAGHIVRDYPIVGCGPNTYTRVAQRYKLRKNTGYYPHNSYLQMAAETGLVGLSVFVWLVGSVMVYASRRAYLQGDVVLMGLLAGLTGFLVQSIFDTNLYSLQLAVLFWVLLGVCMGRTIGRA